MRYRFIEMYDGQQPHVEETMETGDGFHDPEYIHNILDGHQSCVWNCEDEDGKPLTQVFVKLSA